MLLILIALSIPGQIGEFELFGQAGEYGYILAEPRTVHSFKIGKYNYPGIRIGTHKGLDVWVIQTPKQKVSLTYSKWRSSDRSDREVYDFVKTVMYWDIESRRPRRTQVEQEMCVT